VGTQVPELTSSAGIKLNTRLRLPPAVAIVSSPQLRGVHGHPTEPAQSGVAAYQEERRPRPIAFGLESSMTRRRSLILSIATRRMLDNPARNGFEFCFCR
jgi:hypothetical protein